MEPSRRELLSVGLVAALPVSLITKNTEKRRPVFPCKLSDKEMCETILWSKSRVVLYCKMGGMPCFNAILLNNEEPIKNEKIGRYEAYSYYPELKYWINEYTSEIWERDDTFPIVKCTRYDIKNCLEISFHFSGAFATNYFRDLDCVWKKR